ncbi:molybdopterin-dependent oxidoreductase [Sphingobium sp. CFD-1]|uniref:molybdopterin-dependent oxidoreductase n=1 Tax=Sphingobium sp. CFD-1 TaxID=2878545 RepID=UPI00214ACF57|nr:molybdopterin-dependent oxidoreductase [Sphingobium sp. CFD-1]
MMIHDSVQHRTCPLCEGMCGVAVTVEGGRAATVRPNKQDVWSRGHICPKGTTLGALHHDPDRLRTAMVRDGTEWKSASWDGALERLEMLAEGVRDRHGPHAFAAYGGNMAGKDATLSRYSGLMLATSGIQQVYSSGTVDQHPKNLSAMLMFGNEWKIPIPDLDNTDLFVIFGGNPAASKGSIFSHRDVMGAMRDLRARGGRVIVIDPVRTQTARSADQWIGLKPGSDAAFMLGIAHVLFARSAVRLRHLDGLVEGLDALRTLVGGFSPERVAPFCGIDARVIEALADELISTERSAIYGRIGTCTQSFGTLSSWMVDVLAILTGNLDRRGGSMWSRPVAPLVDMLATLPPGMPVVMGKSRVRGVPAVLGQFPASCMAEEIATPGEGQIKGLVTFGANPALSAPDSDKLARALPLLECMVSMDNYLNETTRHAHVIFPSPSSLESAHYDMWSWVFCLTSGGHYSPPVFPAADRPDHWRVVARVGAIIGGQKDADVDAMDDGYFRALATGRGIDADMAIAALPHRGPERILDLAIRSGPFGDRFGAVADGLTLDSFRDKPDGLLIGPAIPRAQEGFETASGKIEIAPALILSDIPRLEQALIAETPSLLLVSRRHLRSLNSWMHNIDTLVKGKDRCTLQMHSVDAAAHALADGDLVTLRSASGEIHVPLEIDDDIRPGVVSMPHGWGHSDPQTQLTIAQAHAGTNSNVLSPGPLVDAISGNAVLNGIPVEVRKADLHPIH